MVVSHTRAAAARLLGPGLAVVVAAHGGGQLRADAPVGVSLRLQPAAVVLQLLVGRHAPHELLLALDLGIGRWCVEGSPQPLEGLGAPPVELVPGVLPGAHPRRERHGPARRGHAPGAQKRAVGEGLPRQRRVHGRGARERGALAAHLPPHALHERQAEDAHARREERRL
eukprot:CAMPEP_0198425700 /NCGR_PEP_ID=MMETSP1452-20131203/4745_1 /TAXON_ID=1181717 /ORGANISM="Synchroma pusillum, Strain CCMP3072" /LENGTH=169 /DNA_ID=CAMNT_0044146059 /DNA_START=90 /DNA_END=595 /DNA_ORIENTATION=-